MQCLSVCPSVIFVNSVETNKYIINFFSPSGNYTILVFSYKTSWQYSDRDPLTEASTAGRVGTNRDYRRKARYQSTTGGRANNKYDNPSCSLSHRRRRIGEPVFITTKRREHDRIYLHAAVNLKRNLRSTYY